jgi:hypothetical protein
MTVFLVFCPHISIADWPLVRLKTRKLFHDYPILYCGDFNGSQFSAPDLRLCAYLCHVALHKVQFSLHMRLPTCRSCRWYLPLNNLEWPRHGVQMSCFNRSHTLQLSGDDVLLGYFAVQFRIRLIFRVSYCLHHHGTHRPGDEGSRNL